MEWVALISGAINLANGLIERAEQSGELTDKQRSDLRAEFVALVDRFKNPPPPPPGV